MKSTKVIKDYANWLDKEKWNFFCTFTTPYPMSLPSARRTMEKLQNSLTTEATKSKIFWAAEPFDSKESYHVHALIKLQDMNNASTARKMAFIKNSWQRVSKGRYGTANKFTLVDPYIKGKGAHYYTAKYLTQENVDYDIFG